MRRAVLASVALAVAAALLTSGAEAKLSPGSFQLEQNATLVHPGESSATAAQVSSTGTPFTWGAVKFSLPSGLTLRGLSTLATDYNFQTGSCWGGSPRFEAWVTNGGPVHKIFFYVGSPPNYTGCATGVWSSTGNLAMPSSVVDDSELPGGSPDDTYANAQAKYGGYAVKNVYLGADGGWQGNQTVDFDNTRVNKELFTYEP